MRRFEDVRVRRQPGGGASPPFQILTARHNPSSPSASTLVALQQPRSTSTKAPSTILQEFARLEQQSPPPPPTAPEPYKLVPPNAALGRAHRRSSFVIIAESRPTTPESRSASPGLPTGRISPFRGHGFKGAPPRARSRSNSPDYLDSGMGNRRQDTSGDKRGSRQNSPRKSLIPQPTRRRSVSLSTKPDERKAASSPKAARRLDTRNRLSVHGSIDNVNDSRRNSTTDLQKSRRERAMRSPSKLSPIQGTPTKMEKSNYRLNARTGRLDREKKGQQGAATIAITGSRFISQTKSPARKNNERERFIDTRTSPQKASRIPMKITSHGSNVSSVESKRNGENNVDTKKSVRKGETKQEGPSNEESRNDAVDEEASGDGKKTTAVGLNDLLRRTSGLTGTSSVVSTTTTTAVQPLRVENPNATIPVDASKNSGVGSSCGRESPKEESYGAKPRAQSGQRKSKQDDQIRTSHSKGSDTPTRTGQNSNSKETASESSMGSTSNVSRSRLTSAHNNSERPTKTHSRTTSHEQLDDRENRESVTSSRVSTGKNQGGGPGRTSRNPKTSKRSVADEISPASGASVFDESCGTVERSEELTRESDRNVSDGKSIASNDAAATTLGKTNQNATGVASSADRANTDANVKSRMGSKVITEAAIESGSTETDQTKRQSASVNKTPATSMTSSTISNVQARTNGVSMNSHADFRTERNSAMTNKGSVQGLAENHEDNASRRSFTRLSSGSNDSNRSTDTGVSVDTVKGVSSPRVKRGMHVVKRGEEIETLSGNVMRPQQQNGEPTALQGAASGLDTATNSTPEKSLSRWRRTLRRYYDRSCPSMRCLACKKNSKLFSWSKKRAAAVIREETETGRGTGGPSNEDTPLNCWSRFKKRCRCTRPRGLRCCVRRDRVAPDESKVCCPPDRRLSAICQRLFACCKCKCGDPQRTRDIRAKHSLTSVAPPPLSEEPKAKIPDVLVEHNSLMRGAIPCLPVPLAWFCLVWNVLLPGSGTVWSGLFNLCTGQPRFSAVAGPKARIGAFIVNLIVGVGQLFTVLFCLVGWGWSVWWGVTMIRLARKYKRFKASEAANSDPEARAGDSSTLATGAAPSQSLRGMERAR